MIIKKLLNKLILIGRMPAQLPMTIEYSVQKNILLGKLLESKESLTDNCGAEVIVSLTSFSDRVENVALVIESLARQTVKAQRIILWLDQGEYNLESLPCSLKKQMLRGLEVRFCKNYKSYKKLIPTLQLQPNMPVITVDDDIFYPPNLIENFISASVKNPGCVLCNRGHQMTFDEDGKPKEYKAWNLSVSGEVSQYIMPTGIGGVYYPSLDWDIDMYDEKLFMEISNDADDVWFKAMTSRLNVKSIKLGWCKNFEENFISMPEQSTGALSFKNVHEGGNDKQISSVYNFFDGKVFRL